MSETNVGGSVPRQATAQHAAQGSAVRGAPRRERAPEPTRWVGWIVFSGTMMLVLGAFHAFQGLVALFQNEYFLVGQNGLVLHLDFTAWGWTHLVLGAVVAAAGIGLLAGQMWARVTGVVLAALSALVSLAFLAAYPIWSAIMIAIDVLVIWALTVHGAEIKAVGASRASYR